MKYVERLALLDHDRIYVREYAGEEPAIVMMHGFPDNLHLYDRLVPFLSPPRRLVTFDFLRDTVAGGLETVPDRTE